jgi:DNA-binding NarL/FixJ family response regulator
MPRTCTICRHPDLEEINKALIAGESIRDIASQHFVKSASVERHKRSHLPTLLIRSEDLRKRLMCRRSF